MPVEQDFIVVDPSQADDPDGSKIDGVLEAQLAIERARSRRDAWMHLLALASIPVWFIALWPEVLPHGVRSLILAAWATCFGLVIALIAGEWRTRRRQAVLLESLRSPGAPRPT